MTKNYETNFIRRLTDCWNSLIGGPVSFLWAVAMANISLKRSGLESFSRLQPHCWCKGLRGRFQGLSLLLICRQRAAERNMALCGASVWWEQITRVHHSALRLNTRLWGLKEFSNPRFLFLQPHLHLVFRKVWIPLTV